MNNREAKFVLSAYRPNGLDATDPAFAEALAQAKADPELGAWLAREQAHAAAVADQLKSIMPPPGLRDAILAGGRLSRPAAQSSAWWRQPVWLAAAATLAILLVATSVFWTRAASGRTLEEYALNFVARGFLLQKHGADVTELRAWLAERGGPVPRELPAKFARLRALGCSTLEFHGRELSLVCFEQDGREFHLFVADRIDLAAPGGSTEPRFFAGREHVAAAWSDTGSDYVLVSDADMPALRRLL